ncbi:hypothetical protein GCM10027022_15520 [Alpinimonas psychrophila]|uniref:Uncharacterized protein n=1 Tax=Alpinimonas psychrophila TaxID=748908 RepID=A0A7W3PPW5_9MICO|nr:hypothetical protein [Alpinimonas psychrophila]MBA8829653.1 hypothetical protein [Alpinimonas psychrophila]
MVPVFAGAMHQFGLPVVTGGASVFLTAFERLLRDSGVEIRLNQEVEELIVSEKRVTGCERHQDKPLLTQCLQEYRQGPFTDRYSALPLWSRQSVRVQKNTALGVRRFSCTSLLTDLLSGAILRFRMFHSCI